jgi:hypothetical protein
MLRRGGAPGEWSLGPLPEALVLPLLALVLAGIGCTSAAVLPSTGGVRQIDIIGQMHSGTNLLEDLLKANFHVNIKKGLYAGWKHNVPDGSCLDHAPISPETLVISMARDASTQLERMYGESYEYKCVPSIIIYLEPSRTC